MASDDERRNQVHNQKLTKEVIFLLIKCWTRKIQLIQTKFATTVFFSHYFSEMHWANKSVNRINRGENETHIQRKVRWFLCVIYFILFGSIWFFFYLCFLRKELNLQQLLDRLRFEIEKNRISLTLHWFETKGEYVNVWREDILIKNRE